MLIDMQSKSSRNSRIRVSEIQCLKICHKRSIEKMTLTDKTKENSRRFNLKKIIPIHRLSDKKGDEKSNKDIGKLCEFYKNLWHNTDESHSKQTLVAKLKKKES
jgi:hypothetical protein